MQTENDFSSFLPSANSGYQLLIFKEAFFSFSSCALKLKWVICLQRTLCSGICCPVFQSTGNAWRAWATPLVPAALGVEGARMISKGASDSHKRACAVLIHKMCIHWQKSRGTLGEWCVPKLMLQESIHSQALGGLAAKEDKQADLELKSQSADLKCGFAGHF